MRPRDALTIAASVASLQRSQWECADRIRKRQRARLAQTLSFALERVPYYRNCISDSGSRGADADAFDRLARFPVLTKHGLQTAGRAILADGIDEAQLFCSRTSGSTGEPTVSWFDRHTWLYTRYAVKLRRMLGYGLGPGARVLIVSEANAQHLDEHRKARMAGAGWLFRQEYVSLHAPLASHVDAIRRMRPDALYAFPSYLAELLDHCDRERLELPPVKVVFTSSELLTPSLRQRLRARLGARMCDVYGCTEFKEVAWQCDAGCYHVNHESVWVECVQDEMRPGSGALLLTTLINRAAPLIRYRVGDLGRLQWTECSCGREGPALSHLEGREVELLALPGGRRVSPYMLTTAIEDVGGLRQYQFVQTAADRLELRFVALDGSSIDEGLLVSRLKDVLGDELRVRPQPVAEIPRTSSGKRKVFVREPSVPAGTC